MKKILSLLIIAFTILTIVGCSSNQPSLNSKSTASTNRLEQIKARGYIEVVTEPYFAPFEFIDSSKSGTEKYVGVDIEIAKSIAQEIGVELRVVPLEFNAVLTGITEKKYDLALSALAYSPVRAEAMNMSVGYHFSENAYGFLVREEDKGKYTTAESVATATMVTQSGSVQETLVNSQIPKVTEFKRVSSMTDAFLMVSERKADVCAVAIANAELYINANPNAGLAVVDDFRFVIDPSMEGTRAGIPLGEDELTAVVNKVLEELISQGKIENWYKEYADYAKSLGI